MRWNLDRELKFFFYCCAFLLHCESIKQIKTINEIRNEVTLLFDDGQYKDLIAYLNEIESQPRFNYSLIIDNKVPSLYSYRGAALASHAFRDQKGAVEAFENATYYFPNDTRSWLNLGEVRMQTFQFRDAISALVNAKSIESMPRLLKVMSWICDWKGFEIISHTVEEESKKCYSNIMRMESLEHNKNFVCQIDSTMGLEFTNVNGSVHKIFNMNSVNAKASSMQCNIPSIPPSFQQFHKNSKKNNNHQHQSNYRLKVGILSADFGVHPVSSLIRGGLQFIDRSRIELFCYSFDPDLSWWGANISRISEHFYTLESMNSFDAANFIASHKIDIMIDLNGHTINTGLVVMKHKPAYLQLSFLGLPTTTGATFIDYYLSDWISTPAEQADHFTEQLLLLPPCYIVNDYAQMQGDIIFLSSTPVTLSSNRSNNNSSSSSNINSKLNDDTNRNIPGHRQTHNYRSSYKALKIVDANITKVNYKHILFATMSNPQKMHSAIFNVWMNILSSVPGSKFFVLDYKAGGNEVHENFISYMRYFGLARDRIGLAPVFMWIDHMHTKTAFDMILDTTVKTGHTTGLDGMWAGVPTITIGGGRDMPARAGEALAVALGSELGIGYTLKEYENLAVSYSKHRLVTSADTSDLWQEQFTHHRHRDLHHPRPAHKDEEDDEPPSDQIKYPYQLRILREYTERLRVTSTLFDSPLWALNFARMMEATWEVYYQAYRSHQPDKRYHIFAMSFTTNTNNNSSSSSSSSSTSKLSPDASLLAPIVTSVSYSNKIKVSQAIEQNSPFWSASEESKKVFKLRFGYDPEDHYRGNYTQLNTKSVASSSKASSLDNNKFKRYKTKSTSSSISSTETSTTATINKHTLEDIVSENFQNNQLDRHDELIDTQKENEINNKIHTNIDNIDHSKKSSQSENNSKPVEYHYRTLCQTFVPPPLPNEIIQRIQAVQDEAIRNRMVLKESVKNGESIEQQQMRVQFDTDNLLMLNIGGLFQEHDKNWINVNADADSYDHLMKTFNSTWLQENDLPQIGEETQIKVIRQMHNLIGFPNGTVSLIYASHILEHNSFGDNMLVHTLLEWRRVLRPGGVLAISVPDLSIISKLFLLPNLKLKEKFLLMKMMYGAQSNPYDYHYMGFDLEMLSYLLHHAGFCEIERVNNFHFFSHQDSSRATFRNYPISLNIVARSCPDHILVENMQSYDFYQPRVDATEYQYDGFRVTLTHDPYVVQDIS